MTKLIRSRRTVLLAVVMALTCLSGCGGGSGQTVSGAVSFDGQPVDDGSVVFAPADGDTKRQKVSVPVANGKYVVDGERGLAAGKYRVEVSWMKKTGKKVATADGPEMRDEKKEALPSQFNSQSTLTADIPASGNKIDFTLKSN